jgi:two-component system nitrate/nitrite response regulator NarL
MAVSDVTAREHTANSSVQTIRLIIADDSSVYRDGLANLLTMQRDFHVIGTADTPSSAADIIRETKPDIVLLGWPASSQGSQRVFGVISDSKSATRVIMLSDDQAKEDFVEAVRQGCCGIVPKRTSTELLLKSIRKVHAGEFWLDRVTTAEVIRKLAKKSSNGSGASSRLGVRDQSGALSQREREIVVLVAQGFKNKEMAERMFISEQTVKNHLHNIFDKLGVSDRLELALYAIHHNLHEN